MTTLLKKTTFSIFLLTIISCGTNKTGKTKLRVNTKANTEYKTSRKTLSGKLTTSEYKALKSNMERELNVKIPDSKSILINYSQEAPNCISYGSYDASMIVDNKVRISSKVSANNNAVDFFVYSKNAFHKNLYLVRTDFRLDSGFFHDTIFTLHENCAAFLIVKPNGEFLKHYGEDYFSMVKVFLEKNDQGKP